MTTSSKHLLLVFAVLAVTPGLPQSAPPDHKPAPQATKKPAAGTPRSHPSEDEGDRIFQQNCSRCHNAPDGFSSRISGAIVRHMRVRASLSQHEEEELIHFLNP
jgi:cytochrome c5